MLLGEGVNRWREMNCVELMRMGRTKSKGSNDPLDQFWNQQNPRKLRWGRVNRVLVGASEVELTFNSF